MSNPLFSDILQGRKKWLSTHPWNPWIDFAPREIRAILKDKRHEYAEMHTMRLQWLSRLPMWFWSSAWESLFLSDYTRLQRALWRLERHFQPVITHPPAGEGVTDQEIEQAKAYPVEKLIEVKRKWALCPAHSDIHPSLYVKNNWAYCFSCQWSGDSIGFYRKLNNCDFVTAVKQLCYGSPQTTT